MQDSGFGTQQFSQGIDLKCLVKNPLGLAVINLYMTSLIKVGESINAIEIDRNASCLFMRHKVVWGLLLLELNHRPISLGSVVREKVKPFLQFNWIIYDTILREYSRKSDSPVISKQFFVPLFMKFSLKALYVNTGKLSNKLRIFWHFLTDLLWTIYSQIYSVFVEPVPRLL